MRCGQIYPPPAIPVSLPGLTPYNWGKFGVFIAIVYPIYQPESTLKAGNFRHLSFRRFDMFTASRHHLPIIRRISILLVAAALLITSLTLPLVARAVDAIQVVNTVGLNLRSGPSISAIIMARIPAGTIMTATARNADTSWVLVRVGNVDG